MVDAQLAEVLASFPAALIVGPRAVEKTTTARRVAGTVFELDDPAQAAQFRADPSVALEAAHRASAGPVLLDEWQEVPEVLGAVKRAVDRGAGPGSFVLTGSVRAPLHSASWPGTGRVITIEMHPLTVLEQRSTGTHHSNFVDHVLSGQLVDLALPADSVDLVGYVELAAAGGYPPVVGLPVRSRRQWLDSYVEQLVLRDVPDLRDDRRRQHQVAASQVRAGEQLDAGMVMIVGVLRLLRQGAEGGRGCRMGTEGHLRLRTHAGKPAAGQNKSGPAGDRQTRW